MNESRFYSEMPYNPDYERRNDDYIEAKRFVTYNRTINVPARDQLEEYYEDPTTPRLKLNLSSQRKNTPDEKVQERSTAKKSRENSQEREDNDHQRRERRRRRLGDEGINSGFGIDVDDTYGDNNIGSSRSTSAKKRSRSRSLKKESDKTNLKKRRFYENSLDQEYPQEQHYLRDKKFHGTDARHHGKDIPIYYDPKRVGYPDSSYYMPPDVDPPYENNPYRGYESHARDYRPRYNDKLSGYREEYLSTAPQYQNEPRREDRYHYPEGNYRRESYYEREPRYSQRNYAFDNRYSYPIERRQSDFLEFSLNPGNYRDPRHSGYY